jgi:hypothetical protein
LAGAAHYRLSLSYRPSQPSTFHRHNRRDFPQISAGKAEISFDSKFAGKLPLRCLRQIVGTDASAGAMRGG